MRISSYFLVERVESFKSFVYNESMLQIYIHVYPRFRKRFLVFLLFVLIKLFDMDSKRSVFALSL